MNNEISEEEIKKTIPITIASQKYQATNIPKEAKAYYLKTVRYLWKKPKTTQTDGKLYHVLGLEELILLKWPYSPRQSIDSMQSLSKCQWHFTNVLLEQNNVKFEWNYKDLECHSNLEKEWTWRNQAPWLQTMLQVHQSKQYGTGTKTDM